MDKCKYEILKKINIEKSGIIKCNVNDLIYKFCLTNGIDNLGDFIEGYNKKQSCMNNRNNVYYFDGIVDLINLIFFNEKLIEEKILSRKMKGYKPDAYNISKHPHYVSFSRLGFNNNEIKLLLESINNTDQEVTIISVIKTCLEKFNFKKMTQNGEIFVTKLYVLNNYYEKNRVEIEEFNSYVFYKAEKDLKELKDLYKNILLLSKKFIMLSEDFEKQVSNLPDDLDSVKKLLKEYKEIDCNKE